MPPKLPRGRQHKRRRTFFSRFGRFLAKAGARRVAVPVASAFLEHGLEQDSSLSPQEMDAFYSRLQGTIFKIRMQKEQQVGEKGKTITLTTYFTGFCISADGLILSRYFNPESVNISVQGPGELTFSRVDLIHHDNERGLILMRAKHCKTFEFVDFTKETQHVAGPHVYSFVYPSGCSSPMLLRGHLAYHCKPDSDIDPPDIYPRYRTLEYIFEGTTSVIKNLGVKVCLVQIASLGASRELNRTSNSFGFEEGYGAPVFNAVGGVLGLVCFQEAGFDFAIHVNVLKEYVSGYSSLPIPPASRDVSSDTHATTPGQTKSFIGGRPRYTRQGAKGKRQNYTYYCEDENCYCR
ncbi:uncharacterized protein LOC126670700 [Mercurialis annua]|uniref:uncharacterized protein LOC126670700 n=1 Tax=Mercurialis annua TaxID=3986 RepID=UPI00215F56CE|nr:uncharacterized protein LOC126670700 [Mercurialis annua]